MAETILVSGRPVGRLLVNTNSHEIAFQPTEAAKLLPDRDCSSVDELRQAVIQFYQKKTPVDAGALKSSYRELSTKPKEV